MTNRFQWRAFITLYVTLSFVLLAVSGLVLYVAPAGRVAHWTHWTFGALDRHGWQAVHTIFALLFVLAAALHLWFNWRILWSYLKTRLVAGIRLKRELALATSLVVVIGAATLADLPPFSSLLNLGEWAKDSWAAGSGEPPVPHAELLTLERLASTTQIPLERILANLEAAGIEGAGPGVTMAALASQSEITPQQLWVKLKGNEKPKQIPAGGGYGRKSVGQVCSQLEIPLESGLARLRAQGIEATADSSMKELARRHDKVPHELLEILGGS